MVGLIGSLRGSSYKIPNSLRFRANASMHLSRTPTVTGSRTTWTWSGWIKRGSLSIAIGIFGAGTDNQESRTLFWLNESDQLIYQQGNTVLRTTTAVFRDTSAWGHLVITVDNGNLIASNRILMYWNGVLLSTTGTGDPGSTQMNLVNVAMKIGTRTNPPTTECFDGYLAEVNFIDGQALAPSSFGRISGSTGVWSPKKYTGTYGTNGFYLNFKDNSAATSAAIGKDYSGKYNNWTPNNISLIAGTSYDSMADSPTPYGDSLQYFTGTRYPYNALRFIASKGSYLNRTPTVAGNQTTWTWSGWVKRNTLGGVQTLFTAGDGTFLDHTSLRISNSNVSSDSINFGTIITNVIKQSLVTTQTYTDRSVWYHIVAVYDTNNAVASDRARLYVNGTQITSFITQTNPTLGQNGYVNLNVNHRLGNNLYTTEYFDGYLADINFIDGQALTPSSFGETVGGVWKPKSYSGTYGTNGFYLKFNDNSAATATALGKDSAGINNWTPTNLAVTDVTSTDITSVKLVNPNYGLQFTASDGSYLNRANASNGNRQTWTWSGWVKRGIINTLQHISYVGSSNTYFNQFYFNADNTIGFHERISGAVVSHGLFTTNNTFSDTSTWYHVAFVWDTTQASQENRIKLFVNNVLQSVVWTTYPGLNYEGWRNTTVNTLIGVGATSYFDGYLAEVNFIDGQALTPSSFGETIDGAWVPKSYTGTYGTNGFYLNFADRSAMTAAAIGNDASSNSNNWTPNGFIISDAIDYTAKTARGNYAIGNPLDTEINGSSYALWVQGNLRLDCPSGTVADVYSRTSHFVSSGKWYAEVTSNQILAATPSSGIYSGGIGIAKQSGVGNIAANSILWYSNTGTYRYGVQIGNISTATVAVGEVFGLVLDLDAGTLVMYRNGILAGTIATGITGDFAFVGGGYGASWTFNFGQRPFAYTPPTGFKALNTYNLPAPAITNAASYMAATTYTGTGVALTVNNITNNKTFKPDLVWIKSRSAATNHALYDSVRGVQKDLVSNDASAETTQTAGLLAFNDNGFNIGNFPKLNTNAAAYVAWQWKAGGSTVANTAGTIASQVNANPAAGFSVVSYTGTGAAATVGHGLGSVPKMIIVKTRTTASRNWAVYHSSVGATSCMFLNLTREQQTASGPWNNTDPTTSVFHIGAFPNTSADDTNTLTSNYVAYCFSEVEGYSKFGKYTGNGSADGPFCYTGFRPKWMMWKRTDINGYGWDIVDSSRSTSNVISNVIMGQSSDIESNPIAVDFLSNGFKVRNGTANDANASGGTYIFAAFAETPFKYSLAR